MLLPFSLVIGSLFPGMEEHNFLPQKVCGALAYLKLDQVEEDIKKCFNLTLYMLRFS